jgi:hypothetical protein
MKEDPLMSGGLRAVNGLVVINVCLVCTRYVKTEPEERT